MDIEKHLLNYCNTYQRLYCNSKFWFQHISFSITSKIELMKTDLNGTAEYILKKVSSKNISLLELKSKKRLACVFFYQKVFY